MCYNVIIRTPVLTSLIIVLIDECCVAMQECRQIPILYLFVLLDRVTKIVPILDNHYLPTRWSRSQDTKYWQDYWICWLVLWCLTIFQLYRGGQF